MKKKNVTTIEISKIKIPKSYAKLKEQGVKDKLSKMELMDSIKARGLLQPICVNTENILVYGKNRLEACKGLGLKTIPAFVIEANEEDSVIIQLTENLLRNKPSLIDFGKFFIMLEKDYNMTREQISKKTGRSFGFIVQCLNVYGSFNKKDHKKIKSVSPTVLKKLAYGVKEGYIKPTQAKEIAENVKTSLLKANDVNNVILNYKKENNLELAVKKSRNIIHVSVTIDIDKDDLARKFGTAIKMAAFVKQIFYAEADIENPNA